jgi:hypothetical protein
VLKSNLTESVTLTKLNKLIKYVLTKPVHADINVIIFLLIIVSNREKLYRQCFSVSL